jgi:lysyl-tRNA synthetase class 2
MTTYPGRTGRTTMIAGLTPETTAVIAGRVLVTDETGFTLSDAGGQIRCRAEAPPPLGAIVEAEGRLLESVFEVSAWRMLAPWLPAPDVPGDPPNWRRAAFDADRRETLLMRSAAVRAIREFFWGNGFVEVETPTLVALPGMEPYLNPFQTELVLENGDRHPAFLITSPEYAMKQILVGGVEKIFQITRSYRNVETLSPQHNPEFTMIEWYRSYASYEEIMRDTEELVAAVARAVLGTTTLAREDGAINLAPSWERVTFAEAFARYAGVDYADIETPAGIGRVLAARGYPVAAGDDWDTLVLQLFVAEIEPKLGKSKPTIVYDYPVSMAALSKRSARDPRFAERFEVYIDGVELANAFTELNDPEEQQTRLEAERRQRAALGKTDYAVDAGFIDALRCGLPPAGGIALGVDRLVMLLLGVRDLRRVLWVPWREMFR